MATYETRKSTRLNVNGEVDPWGKVFQTPSKTVVDLSGVQILHHGVDTLKQFFNGTPKADWVEVAEGLIVDGFNQVVEMGGEEWLFNRGGKSGYKYSFKNRDLGLIVFFVSTFTKPDKHGVYKEGSHMKIECSPHWLLDRDAKSVDRDLKALASVLLETPMVSDHAVHICVDVMGWDIPDDFEDRLVTRAKRKTVYMGVDSAEFDLRSAAVRYGGIQTITLGKVSSSQFTIYDKVAEAEHSDKLEYWEGIWGKNGYQRGDRVRRLELRFHHTVIRQFSDHMEQGVDSEGRPCRFMSEGIVNFATLSRNLNGLWNYGLMNYRLQLTTASIDPFWQFLMEDVSFGSGQDQRDLKRRYKAPGKGSKKNIVLALGNMLTLYARKGFSHAVALWHLERSGIWDDIVVYYEDRDMSESMLKEHIKTALDIRRLNGAAA